MLDEKAQTANTITISELRYRRLFETARDAILILDSNDGKIIDANPYISELLGYSREEFLGKELWEIGLLEDEAASRTAFQTLKTNGYVRYEHLPLRSRISGKQEVEFVSNVYAEGDRTVIQCNIRDVRDRKRVDELSALEQERHMKIASTLQRAVLFQPEENAFSGLSVQTVYSIASDEALVGGDYWDTFAFDNGHVALVCGDVMGHGLPSAVFTTELKYVLRAYIREHEQPSRILNQMNEYVLQSNRLYLEGVNTEGSDTPVCLSLAIIERETGIGSLAVAAMEMPLLIRADGASETIGSFGPPLGLGIGPIPDYPQVEFRLGRGDTLILATDGITEARRGDEFLGDEGFTRLAIEHGKKPLRQMGELVLRDTIAFAGGSLRDDACLVMVRKN